MNFKYSFLFTLWVTTRGMRVKNSKLDFYYFKLKLGTVCQTPRFQQTNMNTEARNVT